MRTEQHSCPLLKSKGKEEEEWGIISKKKKTRCIFVSRFKEEKTEEERQRVGTEVKRKRNEKNVVKKKTE